MRGPDFELDGWCLEDGEARHGEAPETFAIPDLERRQALQRGDLAKLIFRISLDNVEEPEAIERMWVLVRERVGDLYLGVLDNDPFSIEENCELWSGAELPFAPRHVIAIEPGDDATRAKAAKPPRKAWPRD
jgi:hypothetical protein